MELPVSISNEQRWLQYWSVDSVLFSIGQYCVSIERFAWTTNGIGVAAMGVTRPRSPFGILFPRSLLRHGKGDRSRKDSRAKKFRAVLGPKCLHFLYELG